MALEETLQSGAGRLTFVILLEYAPDRGTKMKYSKTLREMAVGRPPTAIRRTG